MKGESDEHVFLSTEEMESKFKSETLATALKLQPTQYKTINIDPSSPQKILDKLAKYEWDKNGNFIVNITGGTKMMSQGVYSFFTRHKNSKIYYWHIGSYQLEQLFPKFDEHFFEKEIQLDLKTYFAVQGYTIQGKSELSYSHKRAETLLQRIIKHGDSAKVSDITRASQADYYKVDRGYLTGGWFEEWMYQTLRDELRLPDSQIAYNLKIKSKFSEKESENDHEIDVAFVYKNTLFIVECKVFSRNQATTAKISGSIFKVSSLRQSLGLKANAIVAILASFGPNKERKRTISYLSNMANVAAVFSLENMKEREHFIQIIKKIINYG